MHPALAPAVAFVVFSLGCASGTPTAATTPSPSPSASASPAPGTVLTGPTAWTFGAVDLIDQAIETQVAYQKGEDIRDKVYGSGGSTYVTIAGQRYPISFESNERLKTIKVGDTVNLHPSMWYACVKAESGDISCHRTFNIYKSSRPQPPLTGI